jgi:hypothetical protein
MVEIDHAALASPPPEPEFARPILASQLLDLEEKQRRRFCENGSDGRVKTGCGEIDEVLDGGFERGIVVGLSAEGNEGGLVSDTSPLLKVLGGTSLGSMCMGVRGNALYMTFREVVPKSCDPHNDLMYLRGYGISR